MKSNLKVITCTDGATISVQAGQDKYSMPHDDDGPYYQVECGYPSVEPTGKLREYTELRNYTKPEDIENFLNLVYPYVPIKYVLEYIRDHGGIKSGSLPPYPLISVPEEEKQSIVDHFNNVVTGGLRFIITMLEKHSLNMS